MDVVPLMVPPQLQGKVQTVLEKLQSTILNIPFAHSDLIVKSSLITVPPNLGTTRQRSAAVISVSFAHIQQILKSSRALSEI